jgi:hypothetical protein
MLKPGDLIKDKGDGDFGLVTSEVRSYGTVEGPDGEYVMVQWGLSTRPQRLILSAIAKGWIEVLSEA